jgi:hypothetical protein
MLHVVDSCQPAAVPPLAKVSSSCHTVVWYDTFFSPLCCQLLLCVLVMFIFQVLELHLLTALQAACSMIRAKDRELGSCHTRLQAAAAVQARAQVMIQSALQLLFTIPSFRTAIAFLQLNFQLHAYGSCAT